MDVAHLENWFVVATAFGPILYGYVSGHPRIEDGTYYRTPLVSIDHEHGQAITKLDVHFTLGKPKY